MSAWRVSLRGFDFRPQEIHGAELLSDGWVQVRDDMPGRAGSSRSTTYPRESIYEVFFATEEEADRYALEKYAEAIAKKRAELETLRMVRDNYLADISRRASHE